MKSNKNEYNEIRCLGIRGIGNKISQEIWGTTPVPQDTSLGQLTIEVNIYESGITHHGSPPDQTTEETHHLVSITRNWPMPDLFTTHTNRQIDNEQVGKQTNGETVLVDPNSVQLSISYRTIAQAQ
ncbi:hypothetical protein F4703DRAFT_1794656 [Phycomyces blakesleeanus]